MVTSPVGNIEQTLKGHLEVYEFVRLSEFITLESHGMDIMSIAVESLNHEHSLTISVNEQGKDVTLFQPGALSACRDYKGYQRNQSRRLQVLHLCSLPTGLWLHNVSIMSSKHIQSYD